MKPISHSRFWILVVSLILFDGVVGKLFSLALSRFDLNNVPRTYYKNYLLNGFGSAGLNFLLYWGPLLAVLVMGCIFFLRQVDRNWRKPLGDWKGSLLWVLLGIGGVAGYQLISTLVIKRSISFSQDFISSPLMFLALYFFRFLPSAAAEELVYRAALFSSIRIRHNIYIALVVSVGVFALGHLYGGLWLMFNSVILALGFTVIYSKSRSLIAAILVHAISNVIYACLNY